jgi:class 3 adenylate cyclase/HAMP domain-containing protein
MFAVFNQPLRIFDRLSIQSKLFLMLLLASVLSILITGYVGYKSGQEALESSRLSALTTLRTTRVYQVESYFDGVKAHIQTLSEDQLLLENFKMMRSAFQDLDQKATITPEAVGQLKNFYEKEFIPALSKNIDGKPLADDYIPQGKAAQYLQYHYAVLNRHPLGQKEGLNVANDDSEYSKIHAKLHPTIASIFQRYPYYDLMLMDAKTLDVIYSYEKEADFAINLKRGPYSDNNLAIVVKELLQSPERQTVKYAPYSNYRPSYGNPTAFILTPLYDGSQVVGVIALQFSTNEIDRVMTNNQQWTNAGLGETGESIVVGADYKMRSNSRFMLQDPDGYIEQMKKVGASARLLDRLRNTKTTILNQEIRLPLVDKALQNQSGVEHGKDYRQVESIMSYSPVRFGDITWALITRMDESEAIAPIAQFRKRILMAAASIIVLITLLSTLLSRLFLNPVYEIVNASRRIVGGHFDTKIQIRSKDELSQLAKSVNQITTKLQAQQTTIEQSSIASKSILQMLLPIPILLRYQAGENPIADKASNVSVIVIELAGFNARSMEWPAEQSVAYLNEIFSSFDEATLNQGIERIRVSGTKYIAVSGLMTPRLDHAKYALEYALFLQQRLIQFNQKNGTDFKLRIGIDAGIVIAGVIGKSYLSYNLWGNTAIQTNVIAAHTLPDEIWVGQAVRDRLGEAYRFAVRPAIDIPGRRNAIGVWSVKRI